MAIHISSASLAYDAAATAAVLVVGSRKWRLLELKKASPGCLRKSNFSVFSSCLGSGSLIYFQYQQVTPLRPNLFITVVTARTFALR
eukprot:COSAG06_NODE_516_length_14818_cov_18.077926_9_plen_87_part_00